MRQENRYTAPELIEVGAFRTDTLGFGTGFYDGTSLFFA
ncbi:lasso RiPP family leader peptide-containing protein [Saccharopolyspora sp. CA-218241]